MLHFFTSDLRRNVLKIVCLSVGLAIGFLLVAKIYFEMTHDTLYKDAERIVKVNESIVREGDYQEFPATPGAIAPGLKSYAPQIECATRFTKLVGPTELSFDDGQYLNVPAVILADSCFFTTFGIDVLQGDATITFGLPDVCAIPRSLASKIDGDPIGLTFSIKVLRNDDYKVKVVAVYEDLPLNASIPNAVFLSLPTIGKFTFDGRENWMGNDRYYSYAKLTPGATADDVKPYVSKMLKDHIPAEVIESLHFNIELSPLSEVALSDSSIVTMVGIMGILALLMLMSASLNYLLIVVGQLAKRGREMAVRKCYGTSQAGIICRVFFESLFFLAVSLGLGILLVFCFPDLCDRLLGATPHVLFTTGQVWLWEAAVLIVLLVITGFVPAYIYCRTPVAQSFRSSGKHHRGWKLTLLSVQFFSCGLLVCLLSLVARQYSNLWNLDMGMETDNVGIASVWGIDKATVRSMVAEIKELPEVDNVATAYQDFLFVASGNNIQAELGNIDKERNVADLYETDPEIFSTLGIDFTEGGSFSEIADSVSHEVIVEERMRDIFRDVFELDSDCLVGQKFYITEHPGGPYTICGVVKNMRRGGFVDQNADKRPAVMFRGNGTQGTLYVKFRVLTPESLNHVQQVIAKHVPDIYVTPYSETVAAFTQNVRNFGTSIIIVSLAIILIALIGLMSYTADEVQNRSKEIAIRKVNGTDASKIILMFCKDVLAVALPSLLTGGAVAVIVGEKWLRQFTDRVSLGIPIMLICLAFLVTVITAIVVWNTNKVAHANPIDHLRDQ